METCIKEYENIDFTADSKNDGVYVDDVTVTYCQPGDCTEDDDIVQTLILSTRNNGMARFINIKTDNWSVENAEELKNIITDFEKRAGLTTEKNEQGK